MDSISKIQIGSNQYQISSQVNTDFANALIGGENLLRCTRYPESTTDSNKIENSWLYGKFVNIQKDGTITTSGVPYINIENCPANSEMEACGAFALDNEVGFCQTSTDSLYIFIAQLVDKYRNTQKGGNTDGVKAISVIPITFSFYCKSTNNTAYI